MTDIKTKRVALYARVSTKDKGQDAENQLAQLREFCEHQGYVIFDEYMDDESGTKGKREREGFAGRRGEINEWINVFFLQAQVNSIQTQPLGCLPVS